MGPNQFAQEDASKKNVATGIFVFDFELFIGVRHSSLLHSTTTPCSSAQ